MVLTQPSQILDYKLFWNYGSIEIFPGGFQNLTVLCVQLDIIPPTVDPGGPGPGARSSRTLPHYGCEMTFKTGFNHSRENFFGRKTENQPYGQNWKK